MESNPSNEFSPANTVETIDTAMTEAINTGHFMQTATPDGSKGRFLCIDGQNVLNFGSCSYLGLESYPELLHEAQLALRDFGTQFSFSRGYLQCSLYLELESNLNAICEGNALVTPSTTLGHISALPVLIQPADIVVIDQFAHASLQIASGLLHGCALRHLRHSRMRQLRTIVETAARANERVWYLCDGVYSMHGDLAPMNELAQLLDSYKNFSLYIDDAHSTSWAGKKGRGIALDHFAGHERVVVALSLNKAFSAAGGAIVFPSSELYWKIRRCGGPMLFSGPVQPPMLGAAVASSRLHLSPQFSELQDSELERIRRVNRLGATYDIPFGSVHETPIFFVPCGPEANAYGLVKTLRSQGFYVCPSVFPAVPRNRSGIRFTISLHNELNDIDAFMLALSQGLNQLGARGRHTTAAA